MLAFLFGRGQTGLTMKTRPQLLFLAGAAVLALGACATLELGKGGVALHEAYIEIHPGTNISAEDVNQLNQILSQYKSFFYKIKTTQNGQIKTQGKLKDIFIEEKLLNEVNNAGGASVRAVQIGTPAHPDYMIHPDHVVHPEHVIHPDHMVHPEHGPHPQFTKKDVYDMVEMVKRVTPILQKYSAN